MATSTTANISTTTTTTATISAASPTTSKYLQGRYLASGGQATVYLSRSISSGSLVVEKVFKRAAPSSTTPDLLTYLRAHQTPTARIINILETPTVASPRLVLEYCNGGDLARLIRTYRERNLRIDEGFIWHVFGALTAALDFLHTGGTRPGRACDASTATTSPPTDPNYTEWTPVVHRDIKPANTLLARDPHDPTGYPLVKLTDFDLAAFYDPNDARPFRGGTYAWQPPEQWRDTACPRATLEGDVWAVGACVHAMATGHPPRAREEEDDEGDDCRGQEQMSEEGMEEKLARRAREKVVKRVWGRYSGNLDCTMRRALDVDIERRASARELRRVVGRNATVWREGKRRMRAPWMYDEEVQDWEFTKMELGGGWPVGEACVVAPWGEVQG